MCVPTSTLVCERRQPIHRVHYHRMAEELTKVRQLGKGAFGVVWLIRSRSGAELCMKEVSLQGMPAKEKSSPLVLRQILTNEAGLTPYELHEKHKAFLDTLPIHVVWGDVDDVVPLKWQVGSFYQALSKRRDNAVTMEVVHGGHILFDEVPEESNGSMISWLLCINSLDKESL